MKLYLRPGVVASAVLWLIVATPAAAVGSWIEANAGQANGDVQAIARDGQLTMLLQSHRATLLLPLASEIAIADGEAPIKRMRAQRLELVLEDARPDAEASFSSPRTAVSRYFRDVSDDGAVAEIRHYDVVRFNEVYPGIDLVYRFRDGRIEYDFEVEANADPSVVRLRLDGSDNLVLDANGNLVASVGDTTLTQRAPEIFTIEAGQRQPLAGEFVLTDNTFGFALAAHNEDKALVIDPVIEFSGYLGGSGFDSGKDIARNPAGNLIITGESASLDIPGAGNLTGGQDIYIAEIDRSSGSLLWINFIGGSNDDFSDAMTLDSQGNIVAVGYTSSPDFPTLNAFQSNHVGSEDPAEGFDWDGLVFKFAADGSQLIFSTYYGGLDWWWVNQDKGGFEWFREVQVDDNDHIFVAGQTGAPDFPVTANFQQRGCMSTDINSQISSFVSDIVVIEFDPAGNRLFATCIGGAERDGGRNLQLGADGSIYVGGFGRSPDLPLSADAFQQVPLLYSAFVLKLDETRLDLDWGSYVGGSGFEFMQEIAVAADGSVIGVGNTESSDFPLSANALQTQLNAGGVTGFDIPDDAFIFQLSADGTSLLYGSYFGGQLDESAFAVQVDSMGRIYLSGITESPDLLLRTPLIDDLGAWYGPLNEIIGDPLINDIEWLEEAGTIVVAARDGINPYAARNGLTWDVFELSADDHDTRAIVTGSFDPNTFQTGDLAAINRFAPNQRFGNCGLVCLTPIGEFGDATSDSRAAAVITIGGNVNDIVVANYGQANEIYIDATGAPVLVGAADGNSVDVIASYLVGSTSDLVFANEGQDVRLYPFAGGAYGPAMILSNASPNVTSLAAADIDGDTDNDLLIGNNPGPIQLVRFEAGAPLGLESIPGTEGSTVNALLLRDFDADGDKDLLAGTDGVDLLYFNDGTGHFEQQPMPSPDRRTTALDASFQCEGCIDVAAAGDDGVGEYQYSRQAIYVAVIDPVTGSLEFSSFFDGGGLENTFRGLTLVADGHFLLAGETDGAAWPVIGTSQMGAAGRSDAVFIEVDIDVDDDGVLDGSDNCLEVANPAQRDTDGDSFGNYCDGDFNNDGAINFADLTVMKSVFFSGNPNADLNGDGAVNFADLTLLKAQFFGAPGPSGLLLP